MTTSRYHADLRHFSDEVGIEDPVAIAGGRTQWHTGGTLSGTPRIVSAPSGILAYEPPEMTVRVLAGTPVATLQAALGEAGQCANLADFGGSTVGGVLAVGWSATARLGWGPIRDSLLQANYISADGLIVTAGGPTVKNVTGFDLCRLLVGSQGTLGFLGEVILRTRPLPQVRRWFAGQADPFAVRDALYRPLTVLWDGTTTWVCLAGYRADVDADAAVAGRFGLVDVAGPPSLPPYRWSTTTKALRTQTGVFVAEIGVGTVHRFEAAPKRPLDTAVAALHDKLKANFDPTGRLNPGRDPRLT